MSLIPSSSYSRATKKLRPSAWTAETHYVDVANT